MCEVHQDIRYGQDIITISSRYYQSRDHQEIIKRSSRYQDIPRYAKTKRSSTYHEAIARSTITSYMQISPMIIKYQGNRHKHRRLAQRHCWKCPCSPRCPVALMLIYQEGRSTCKTGIKCSLSIWMCYDYAHVLYIYIHFNYTNVYTQMYMHACVLGYIFVYIYTYMHTYIHIYISIYIYVCVHLFSCIL